MKVTFVELDDRILFLDGDAKLDGNMLCRNLMSVVDPRDRRVVVLMHKGITGAKEIAHTLGYANHSPVSKALARIRHKAARWLE